MTKHIVKIITLKNYKLEPYLLNPDSGIIYNDSGIISRSGAYSTGEIKKIFLNDEQYNLKFFGDVKKEEYDKIMFLGATLWNTIHVFEHVIDDKTIAYWLANSAYIVNNNNGISQPLTGEYKKLFNEFKENYISLKEEEKYFDIDILNDYTKKFFGKVINTDADNNLYIDFEDVYHYAEGNLSVKGNKFSCNLKSNGRFDDVIQGLSVSNVKTYHNFAIIKINQFLYGHIEEAYLLVEKKNVDGVNRLFPILVNNYPYTFEAAEKELGHTLLKDYLSGFDKEEALKKNSSEELISYIDSFFKENNFIETSGLIDARQDELLDIYNEFKNNKLAYNLNAAVEFNQNFYESQKIDIEDVVNLQNYLSKLDIKDFNKYKPVVQIKMKPNEVGRYIFSFKDELKDDIIYNFHLDGLDINIILTKDDINRLKEKKYCFCYRKLW